MAAVLVEVANKVAAVLRAHAFTETCEVVRQYLPELKPEDASNVFVTVVPKTKTREWLARSRWRIVVEIDVGIMRRVESTEETDTLAGLAEEIEEYMADADQGRLTTEDGTSCRFMGLTLNPIYAPEHLREARQFTQVITLTYWLEQDT